MANITRRYNNNSLGQSIEIVYDDVAKTIVSGTIIAYLSSYPNLAAGGLIYNQVTSGTIYEVRAQNNSPYAYVVPVVNTCIVNIDSVTVFKASLPSSGDGQITVNATSNQPTISFQLLGGPDNVSIIQSTNVFSLLKPGSYQVKAITSNFLTGAFCETALQNVEVGYLNIVCDLVLGTVNTTAAPGATLTIVNYTTSLAEPVEYRLDSGAWQNSNVFTGVSAGVKVVQIRFKNFPTCSNSRNVTVSGVACTLGIASVQIVPESIKFGKNGAITIIAANATGAVTYQIIGPSGTLTNNTGIFTGLRPGNYTISVTDSIGCNAVGASLVAAYKLPFFDVPLANSHRFVTISGPVSINNLQDFDNRLLSAMRFPFEKETCVYGQKINKTDSTTVQWRSSYSQHTVQLRKQSDNSLITAIVPVKRTSYTNRLVTKSCTITAGDPGYTQVYFPIEGLPDFYQIGMDITLAGAGAMNGTYEIKDIVPGTLLATGFQVLILQVAYTLIPTTQACSNDTLYNIEDWEVYEVSINWNLYAVDFYYITIKGADPQFSDVDAQSEPVDLQVAHDDTVLINYWNVDNAFLIDYSTGIKMVMRINARMSFPKNGGQITGMEDSVRRYIKLQENVTRLHEMEIWDAPFYLLEKLQLALAHDTFSVNNVRYASEEKMETQEFEMEVLMNGRVRLRQIDFENENKTDTNNSNTMSILSIENAVIDCGGHDATGNTYPIVGGTGFGGSIKRGNWFIVSVASAPDVNGDVKFPLGCTLQALVDNPGQVDSNWKVVRA